MELVYFVLVGAVAGFLAGKIMKMEIGLVTTVVVGIVGGFVGGWGLSQLGLVLPGGLLGEIVTAALGAVVLMFLYKMVTK